MDQLHLQLNNLGPYAPQAQHAMVHSSADYAYPSHWIQPQPCGGPPAGLDAVALGEVDPNQLQLAQAQGGPHSSAFVPHAHHLPYATHAQPSAHAHLPLAYVNSSRAQARAVDNQPPHAHVGKQMAPSARLQQPLDAFSSYEAAHEGLNRQLFGPAFEGPTFVDSTTYGSAQLANAVHPHNHNQHYDLYHHQHQTQTHPHRTQRGPGQVEAHPPFAGQSMHTNSNIKNSAPHAHAQVQRLNESIGSSAGSSTSSALVPNFSRRASNESSPASSRLHSPEQIDHQQPVTVCQQKNSHNNARIAPAVTYELQSQGATTRDGPAAQFSPERAVSGAQVPAAGTPSVARSAAAAQGSINGADVQRTPNNGNVEGGEVPEAVFHLLRLGQPNSTGGSAATNATAPEFALDEVDNSCDEDAEGESDDTSVHSTDGRSRSGSLMGAPLSAVGSVGQANVRVWNHDTRQPPICIPLPQTRGPSHAGSHSRQPSISSSVASARVRQHRPARAQREQSAADSSRRTSGGSTSMAAPPAPAANGRRTSGRARRLSDRGVQAEKVKNDSDYEPEMEVSPIDEDEVDDEPKSAKAKGKAKAPPKARAAGRKPSKRASLGGPMVSTELGPPPTKKPRVSAPPALGERAPTAPRQPRRVLAPPTNAGQRTFPAQVEPHSGFPRFYRQFPLSSRFPPDSDVHGYGLGDHPLIARGSILPEGADVKWNKVNDPRNLYIARLVQGNAEHKAGLCPICVEDTARGGEGTEKWLKLKNSSYVYHLSYAHGLSNLTGKPFSPPIKTRQVEMPPGAKDSRSHMTEGLCHACDQWIPLLSVKNVDAIVPELLWWKHAKKCHGESTIPGETDAFLRDEVFDLIENSQRARSAQPSAASSIHGSSQNGRQSASGSIAGSHSQHQSRSASPAGSHHSNASLQSQYAPARSGYSDRFSPFAGVHKDQQQSQSYGQQAQAGPSNWDNRGPPGAYQNAHLSPGAGQPNGVRTWHN